MENVERFEVPMDDGAMRPAFHMRSRTQEQRGVVQVLHGMAEHKDRYLELASFLSEAGFAVVAHDHRGHGRAESPDERTGLFAAQNGWQRIVADVGAVRQWIEERYGDSPVFLFGHSMGSFVARACMLRNPTAYDGYVLSGTAAHPGAAGYIGKALAAWHSRGSGALQRNPFLSRMTSRGFNKRFGPARTDWDWLSRDEHEVDAYIDDPACGFTPCSAFFRDLATGVIEVNSPKFVRRIDDAPPILLISGDQDPVGDYGSGVHKVDRLYREYTRCDVTVSIFAEDRHELIHELDRTDVFRHVSGWIGAHTHWGSRRTRTDQ